MASRPNTLDRLGPFIVFFLLEGLCIYLIIAFNQEQQLVFASTYNQLTGTITERIDGVYRYLGLGADYDSLVQRNARLQEQLLLQQQQEEDLNPRDSLSGIDSTARIYAAPDTAVAQPQYQYIPARVIMNSIARRNNTFTINRGSRHGVQPNMGVINEDGVIGVVQAVTKHFAQAMSILHSRVRITVQTEGPNTDRSFGTLLWRGNDMRYMHIEDIPFFRDVALGDTVRTSYYSQLFPPGIFIGTVETIDELPGGTGLEVRVDLNIEMDQIRHVYVVDNRLQEELEQLEAMSSDE